METMTQRRQFWTILVLAIVLIASLGMNVFIIHFAKARDTWRTVSEVSNTQFRVFRYVAIRDHLRKGNIDKAGSLLDAMLKGEKSLLRLQQDPEKYSATVNRAASMALARIEAGQEHGSLPEAVEQNARVHE